MASFKSTTKEHPCPACGKYGHCQWAPCGAHDASSHRVVTCYNSNGSAPEGWQLIRETAEGHTFGLVDPNFRPGRQQEDLFNQNKTDEPKRLTPLELNHVYTAIVDALEVADETGRGFTREQCDKLGYRVYNAGKAIRSTECLPSRGIDLLACPGIIKDKNGSLAMSTRAMGTLIPLRSRDGSIHSLKIRRSDERQIREWGKYAYPTSSRSGGPKALSGIHWPLGSDKNSKSLRITEGEFKADFATFKLDIPTVSLPGVSSWKKVLEIKGVNTFYLAFDSDWRSNEKVERSLFALADELLKRGKKVYLESWDPKHKGLDDALLAGVDIVKKAYVKEFPWGDFFSNGKAEAKLLDMVTDGQHSSLASIIASESEDFINRLKAHMIKSSVKARTQEVVVKYINEIRGTKNGQVSDEQGNKGKKITSVKETSPTCPVPACVVNAPGYKVKEGCVTSVIRVKDQQTGELKEEEFKIFKTPVVLAHSLVDDDGFEDLVIVHKRNGKWRNIIAPTSQVMDANKIMALADQRLMVNSTNKKELVEYLAKQLEINADTLPIQKKTTKIGFYDKTYFIAPRVSFRQKDGEVIRTDYEGPGETRFDKIEAEGENVYFVPNSVGTRQVAEGYHSKGSLHEWSRILELLNDHPKILLGIYASVAAPLIYLLDMNGFIVSYDGITTTGKTTTLGMCASVWGKPTSGKSVIHTWNATRTWLEETFGMCSGLPVFLDDTQNVSSRSIDLVKEIIYDVAQGKGKGRGNVTGQRASKEWKTVLFSTGEQPILSFSNDGGTHARTIGIFDSPFSGNSMNIASLIEKINEITANNYGVAGEAVASKLVEDGIIKEVREWYQDSLKDNLASLRNAKCKSHLAGRIAKLFALIECGVILLFECGAISVEAKLNHQCLIRDFCLDYCMNNGLEEADKVEEARLFVLDWVGMNPHRFYNMSPMEANGPSIGWAGKFPRQSDLHTGEVVFGDTIYWDKSTLINLLKDEGFHAKTIIKEWVKKGIVGSDSSHETRKDGSITIKVDSKTKRVIPMLAD